MTIKLGLILLAGAIWRLYHNISIALWHDEAFSALYTRDYSWGEMLYRITLDVHPPLYYFVLKFWTYLFGHSLLALRSLSVLFGVLTIWAGYLLVKKITQREGLALLAALLLALNPFQIQYALEARMYTLGTFLSLVSCYLLLNALETNKYKYWIWYAVAVAASLYTHYFLFFSVAAQALYAIYHFTKATPMLRSGQKKLSYELLGSWLLTVILYLPWLPTFLKHNQQVQNNFWIPPMDRWSIPNTLWKMLVGGQGGNPAALVITSLLVAGLVYWYYRKTQEPAKLLIVSGLLIPFVGAVLISVKTAIFLDRYFVFAGVFLLIILSGGVWAIPAPKIRRALATAVVIVTLLAFFKNWSDLDIKSKPGMAAAASLVNDQFIPDDKIYVGSSSVFFTFKYYNQTGARPQLYSTGPLETIPHFFGTALLTHDDLILDFNQTPSNSQVWLIWTTGFSGSKPNVPGSWGKVSENVFDDAPGFKGQIFVTRYHVN